MNNSEKIRKKIMKKDYKIGFKYELKPLGNSLFCTFTYLVCALPFLVNNLIVLIITAFCIGFTLFVAMKLYNKCLSQRYRYKIGVFNTEKNRCHFKYLYTNMFSVSDDGTVFICLEKRDKKKSD